MSKTPAGSILKTGPNNTATDPKHRTLLSILLLLFALLSQPAQGRELTDMNGRKVTIPDTISRVVGVSPPATYLLYAIDPTLIGGANTSAAEKKFMVEAFTKLPVIGGFFGQSKTLNQEILLQIKPDFVVYGAWRENATMQYFESTMAQLHLPSVGVHFDSIDDYPAALRFLGDVLGRQERGKVLGDYAAKAISEAKSAAAQIPETEKVTVYYAEGMDGLSTEKSGSLHAELIPLAGGINVHKGESSDSYGMDKISMEQIILYDPAVILIKEKAFFETIFTDPRWKNLHAVRDKRVYLIPSGPFNWFDRPPSIMRLLGIKWLLKTLHPKLYPADIPAETKAFYKLFLGVELSDADVHTLLNP
jgi:iron complex transport system substrate-binding protein